MLWGMTWSAIVLAVLISCGSHRAGDGGNLPQGKAVYSDGTSLYVCPLDGKASPFGTRARAVKKAGFGEYSRAPCWSPDGRSIFFSYVSDPSVSGKCFGIASIGEDGAGLRSILSGDGINYDYPSVSPDGGLLATMATSTSGDQLAADLEVFDVLTMRRIAGCSGLYRWQRPAWSSDSAYLTARLANGRLMAMQAGQWHPRYYDFRVECQVWRPDGGGILVVPSGQCPKILEFQVASEEKADYANLDAKSLSLAPDSECVIYGVSRNSEYLLVGTGREWKRLFLVGVHDRGTHQLTQPLPIYGADWWEPL